MDCHICGIEGEKVDLFDAVVREGLVKVCEECSIKENIHIIRNVDSSKIQEAERNKSVYEKLSRMAGVDPVEHKAKFGNSKSKVASVDDLRDRKKAELTFPGLKQVGTGFKDDLIRNYHWSIFKARRAMKLTQKQLAEAISEPEESVKYVERGVLPENYQQFIKKIENYLGITLFKKPEIKKKPSIEVIPEDFVEEGKPKKLSFFAAWRARRKNKKRNLEEIEEIEIDLSENLGDSESKEVVYDNSSEDIENK